MKDKVLRKHLGFDNKRECFMDSDSGINLIWNRLTRIEAQLQAIYNYLEVYLQTDCYEKLPKLNKFEITKKARTNGYLRKTY